jgi:hypothetical protein
MNSWFRRVLKSQCPRPSCRPSLEALEDRTLLNNRFVVPVGLTVDGATTFATLQDALSTPGLVQGNTIQIEPGSTPGTITATSPLVANLTIAGDPAAPLSGIPQFTISGVFTESAAQAGFTLQNVNVGFVDAGALSLNANATITGSFLTDLNSTAQIVITFAGTANNLTNSTFAAVTPVTTSMIDIATPAAGSANVISGDTFVNSTTGSTFALLDYFNGSAANVTDRVVGCTFTGSHYSNGIVVEESVNGLSIQGNTFAGAFAGISVTFSLSQNLQIIGNSINLDAGGSGTGINVEENGAGTMTGVIADNQVSTAGAGTGLSIGFSTGTVALKVQGNDFHDNKIGVFIGGPGSAASIDLGGGTQGSLGQNNFRSFTFGTASSAAISVESVTGSQNSLSAQHNLFANGVTPANVVFDGSSTQVLNVAGALTGNAALVATLYNEILKRPADLSNPSGAGSWVNQLNSHSLTQAQVASAITHSTEALDAVVNGLYLRFLHRAADLPGQAADVQALQHGGTIEQIIINLVTSREFANDIGSDAGFVESLYVGLLGRIASNGEVTGWLGLLSQLGRAAVANAILTSGEFRGDVVTQLYGATPAPAVSVVSLLPPLLHRAVPPAASEVNGWVSLNLDALTLETDFASGTEFFLNG